MRNYYKKLTDADYSIIPFAYIGDSRAIVSKHINHRLSVMQKFIGKDIRGLHTLDVGGPNGFGERLGIKDTTLPYDLNFVVRAPSYDYDMIFCLETIEHIMNPLMVMIELRKLLKPGGVMYLSTPRPFWGFLQGGQHFTEYKPRPFERMCVFAGYEVVRRKKFCLWDWDFFFWGVRPMFRVLFHRNYLYELRVKD